MPANVLLLGAESPLMDRMAQALSAQARVSVSFCPGEALAQARRSDFDVVVVNFRDLLETGVLFLRNLKRANPLTEVITLSVPSTLRYSIEGMKLGAFADLSMPFEVEEFSARVAEAWKKKSRAKKGLAAFRRRMESLAASAAFAEAGQFDAAVCLSQPAEDSGDEEDRHEQRQGSF
ncbi:MAG: hypothetical protein JRI97_08260 [Deltaproteobacteria bacterium]|nr:hypothetical protein [Deltaproteobacteria bacterium]